MANFVKFKNHFINIDNIISIEEMEVAYDQVNNLLMTISITFNSGEIINYDIPRKPIDDVMKDIFGWNG